MARKKYTEDYLELDEIKRDINKKDSTDVISLFLKLKNNKHFLILTCVGAVLVVAMVNFLHKSFENNVVDTSTNIVDANPITDEAINIEQQANVRTDINENLTQTLITHYDNDDIIIYLSIIGKDDVVNLEQPVAQSVNNTYYFDHNLNKAFDQNGSAFVDCNLKFDTVPKNLVIYGNDLFEDSPFFNISLFLDKEFYNNNKNIEIKLQDKTINYEVFAFVDTEKSFKEEPITFSSEESFNNYLENIKKEAIYIDEENFANTGDNIVTIVTSSNKANGSRYILYGKQKVV